MKHQSQAAPLSASNQKPSALRIDTAVSALSQAWVAAMLCVFAITGIYTAWRAGHLFPAVILGCGALMFYLQQQASDRYNSPRWDIALITFLALSSAGTLLWALFFDSIQVSDFGVYFRCGTAQHHSFDEWVSNCQSAYLNPNITYWLRSFFYSAPIGSLFGGNYAAFKLFNAAPADAFFMDSENPFFRLQPATATATFIGRPLPKIETARRRLYVCQVLSGPARICGLCGERLSRVS